MCENADKALDEARFKMSVLFCWHTVLELKVFTEGILDFSFYHKSINQKIWSTTRKKYILVMFLGIKW